METGKTSKYLKYAIGEIILVVIGILIALQINNWNEFNKERENEKIILNEIRENLKFDLEDFESNIANLQNKIISAKTLLKIIDNKSDYTILLDIFSTTSKRIHILVINRMDIIYYNLKDWILSKMIPLERE